MVTVEVKRWSEVTGKVEVLEALALEVHYPKFADMVGRTHARRQGGRDGDDHYVYYYSTHEVR
jgi:hypothetical protein